MFRCVFNFGRLGGIVAPGLTYDGYINYFAWVKADRIASKKYAHTKLSHLFSLHSLGFRA
jgi:hypothetical protein